MLSDVTHWEIAEEESVSDHNILKFSTNLERDKTNISNSPELRCIIREQQSTEFYKNLFT